MGVHDGHRARLREKFTEYGLETFNDVNALELLLFYSVPRKDTNELAHRLIAHFGNLSEVFNASIEELTEVQGISYNSAVLISLMPQLYKKAEISSVSQMKKIKNSRDAGAYLLPRFLNERDEVLLLLCLDNKRDVICCREIARGTVNSIDVSGRRVVETALKVKANSVIIAHNHPRGILMPSREDESFTKELMRSLNVVGIKLEDHIIIADKNYVSLMDAGIFHFMKF
jgi:DNA repair protein RadC